MQPLHELLHRIRWDADFGRGEFALGYYDRVAREERVVPFSSVTVDAERESFTLLDEYGIVARIPLPRVRTVYKDGRVIWQRPTRRP
jgi:uncharacterized protein (UPF0248 family)